MPFSTPFKAVFRPAVLPFVAYAFFYARHWSPAYLAGGAAVLAGSCLLQAFWDRMAKGPWGLMALIAAGASLPALGAWQFLRLEDVGDIDHASYSHALWNLGRGHFDFAFHGRNMFGIHSQYTSLAWVPVKWLTGDLGLKLGQALCILSAAYLSVRRFRGDASAAWGALALLLSPAIASQFVFGFHPELLAAPLLVLALDAYREERLGRFLACAAALAFTKETLTLAVGGILILALLEKRPWKWWLLPGLVCSAQMGLYWFAIMPRFAPEGNQLGHFLPPLSAVPSLWWRGQTLLYAIHTLLPFLPLILASPKRYLVLPLPLMAFYAAFPDPLFVQMWPNYAFPAAILLSGGWILPREKRLDGRVLAACAMMALLSYPLWREVLFLPRRGPEVAREVERLRAGTPAEASVLVNGNFTTRFASRKVVGLWGWRDRTRPLEDFDRIVIDTTFRPWWLVDRRDLDSGVVHLRGSPDWEPLPAAAPLLAFRRREAPP